MECIRLVITLKMNGNKNLTWLEASAALHRKHFDNHFTSKKCGYKRRQQFLFLQNLTIWLAFLQLGHLHEI